MICLGLFSFNKKENKNKSNQAEDTQKQQIQEEEKTAKDWLPIKDVKDGIIHLKNGEFVKVVEVVPINFKLKSVAERRMLVLNYRAFLKSCRFPMQISIQCRKANIDPHITRMKKFYRMEKNHNVKNMIKGYIRLVTDIGTQGTITRRYFIIFPYIAPPGIRTVTNADVARQMNEKSILVKDYLLACGNEVIESPDTEFAVNVLYSYLNKRTCEVQKIGKKLVSLMGTFLDIAEEPEDEMDEEDF